MLVESVLCFVVSADMPLQLRNFLLPCFNFLYTLRPAVRKHLWNLSKCLDSAVKQNLIAFNPEDYVFTHVDGRLITLNYVTKLNFKLIERSGLEIIRFHDIRHSSARYLLYLGFDMKSIQFWLGHGDIGTTMNLYVHLDLEATRNIADSLN